jgi:ComF family protein
MHNLATSISSYLIPWHNYTCIGCRIRSKTPICEVCLSECEEIPHKSCRNCLTTIPDERELCSDCHFNPPYFDKIHASYSYANPIAKMLHQFKYQKQIRYAYPLGWLLNHTLQCITANFDVIIPMPLHAKRLKERGFNQIDLLLSYYQKSANPIIVNPQLVSRHKDTPHQTLANKASRQSNLYDAFKLNGTISGLHILIVDDVVTTGATINELAKMLKLAGCAKVDVACLMRAL